MCSFLFFLSVYFTLSFGQNVLIIYCDDSGKEINAYGAYGNDVKTPNIDNLANHSMVFNYGYTSVSSCSPSRSALLTGLPVHQNGMYGLHSGGLGDHFNSFSVNNSHHTEQYPLSIGRILKDNGYYTGIVGKYHVGPMNVYYFDYMRSADNGYNGLQVGRNITQMKLYMIDFFDNYLPKNNKFFLYMAFIDTHRGCGGDEGPFCNFWGNGTEGMGTIPDWTPVTYDPNTIKLPYWIPDTPTARQDYVDYLESYSRLDQGVGLFMKEIKERGYLNDTIIIFASDNGEPFPSAKTNLYEEGQIEPYMISIPDYWTNSNNNGPVYTDFLASTTDVLPTVLDWCNIKYPQYSLNGKNVVLTGQSLLDIVKNKQAVNTRSTNIFGSHIWHQTTMYYPMRTARNDQYRLIHNLNPLTPFYIAGDLYNSPTWLEIINNSLNNKPTHWYKNLTQYYFRSEWELFDLNKDPKQLDNLAYNQEYKNIFDAISKNISDWLDVTNDPWRNCNANYEC